VTAADRVLPEIAIAIPATMSKVLVDSALTNILDVWMGAAYVVPPALLPDVAGSLGRSVLVATDGSENAIEAVRTHLSNFATTEPPLTPAERVRMGNKSADAYRMAALVGLVGVVLVGGLTLAVTTADGLRERRRPHAALIALGTPLKVLRRSVLLQVATPLVLSVGIAIAVSASASSVYLRLGAIGESPEDVLPLPWAGYATIAAAAIVATLLATAAALPFVRSARQPEALRAE
jgi:predicted lysophospholipase L1 biosynthesis ABC-type transport system permease subunit